MEFTLKMQQLKTERDRSRLQAVDKHPEWLHAMLQQQREDDDREKELIFANITPPQKNPPNTQCIEY